MSHRRTTVKLALSAGFVFVALALGALDSAYGRAILVGLALSWVGDAALLGRGPSALAMGIAAFSLAHIAYGMAFVSLGVDGLVALVAFVAAVVAAIFALRPVLPGLVGGARSGVAAYTGILSVVFAAAWGAVAAGASPGIGFAMTAFAVSDVGVARRRFLGMEAMWALPLYYAAQYGLAASVALG